MSIMNALGPGWRLAVLPKLRAGARPWPVASRWSGRSMAAPGPCLSCARGVFVSMGSSARGGGSEPTPDRVMMKEQSVKCVIGCNPDERVREQELVISVAVWVDLRSSLGKHVKHCDLLDVQKTRMDAPDWDKYAAAELAGTHNYSTLAKIARKTAEEGKYFTIEALAEAVARDIVLACNVPRVTVLIDKPEALRKKGARAAAVEISRNREDFFFPGPGGPKPLAAPDPPRNRLPAPPAPSASPAAAPASLSGAAAAQLAAELAASCEPLQKFGHIAYIALGSNVGERAGNIQQALNLLCGDGSVPVQLLATSFLYESPASYVTDQPNFLNAVCKVSASLSPCDRGVCIPVTAVSLCQGIDELVADGAAGGGQAGGEQGMLNISIDRSIYLSFCLYVMYVLEVGGEQGGRAST